MASTSCFGQLTGLCNHGSQHFSPIFIRRLHVHDQRLFQGNEHSLTLSRNGIIHDSNEMRFHIPPSLWDSKTMHSVGCNNLVKCGLKSSYLTPKHANMSTGSTFCLLALMLGKHYANINWFWNGLLAREPSVRQVCICGVKIAYRIRGSMDDGVGIQALLFKKGIIRAFSYDCQFSALYVWTKDLHNQLYLQI